MNPYAAIILQNLVSIVCGVFLVPLMGILVQFAVKKLGLHLDAAQEAKISEVLTESISYGEEWANGKLKVDPATKPTGAQKLEQALAYAVAEAQRRGLDKEAEQALEKKLVAALGLARDVDPAKA